MTSVRIIGKDVKFIKLSDADLISNYLESQGVFEAHVLKSGEEVLKNVHSGKVLDIGANMGSFVIPMAKSKPSLDFIAFEPQKRVYYQLCGNIAINKLNNIDALNFGLGEATKLISISMPDYDIETNIGAFSLDDEVRSKPDYLCKTKGVQQNIEIRQLDSFLLKDIKLIKIDVEGMELDVLKGGVETLKQNHYPPIIFESWVSRPWFLPRREELLNWLKGLGYAIKTFGEDNIAIYKEQ